MYRSGDRMVFSDGLLSPLSLSPFLSLRITLSLSCTYWVRTAVALQRWSTLRTNTRAHTQGGGEGPVEGWSAQHREEEGSRGGLEECTGEGSISAPSCVGISVHGQ